MNIEDEAEVLAARRALQAWFESQQIEPPDAGIIMMELIGALFVQRTKDLNELVRSVNIFSKGLAMTIAMELRKSR